MQIHAIVTGYYGQNVRASFDNSNTGTWETVQALYRDTCPSWHDGTLVSIHRQDGGAAYNAPGVFTCRDRDGASVVVILEA